MDCECDCDRGCDCSCTSSRQRQSRVSEISSASDIKNENKIGSNTEFLEQTPVNEVQLTTEEDNINPRGETESENDRFEETENCDDVCITVESIYVDDGCKKKEASTIKPGRRPTKVQLATMDALALFNGSDLGSITFKQKDLKSELKMEAEQLKSQTEVKYATGRPCTRLQAAKQETDAIFKDIPLGECIRKSVAAKRKRVRYEKDEHEMKRLTKLETAKAEALEAFGGAPLDHISKRQKKDQDNVQVLNLQSDPSCSSSNRLSRVERARLEALQSFGGSGLGDVMKEAKKCVARTLEIKLEENHESDDISRNEEHHTENDKENLISHVLT